MLKKSKVGFSFILCLTLIACFSVIPMVTVNAASTSGKVSFQVTLTTYYGGYAPKHYGVIWVQDSAGKFVKTLNIWGGERKWMANWNRVSGRNTVDAVTSATIRSGTAQTVTWDCTDVNKNVVTDGTYRICVEFTESDANAKYAYYDFKKDTAAVNLSPANQTNFTNVKITYAPSVTPPMKGDLNDDKVVDSIDFALMQSYLHKITTSINLKNADMNNDGAIDAIDYALLKKALLGR